MLKKINILSVFSLLFVLLFTWQNPVLAQARVDLDVSPLDFAYFPDNFAHDRQPGDKAIIRVIYGRPQMKGRKVFGEMVPYGKVWRTGANEATEIKLYQDIKLGEKSLKAGTYSMFTIPGEKSWEIIINNDLDYWGAYSYNKSNDVIRFKVKSGHTNQTVEAFTIHFDKRSTADGIMTLAWENTLVEIPFTY